MDRLYDAYKCQRVVIRLADASFINSPYFDPILTYCQVARLTVEELKPILPILKSFLTTRNALVYLELVFIGLLTLLNIRPMHYIMHISSKTIDQLKDAVSFATNTLYYYNEQIKHKNDLL